MSHTFLVVTVKEWLKSAYIYQGYRKIKTTVLFFWNTAHLSISISKTIKAILEVTILPVQLQTETKTYIV